MSGFQEFFAPFTHLLFANRDKAIVVLGILLGWFTIQLLIARWRNERLQRELAAAKAAPASSSSRRYSPTPQIEEAPVETGGPPAGKGRPLVRPHPRHRVIKGGNPEPADLLAAVTPGLGPQP